MSFAIRLRIVALLFASGVACGGVDPGATSGTGGAANATGGNNSSGGSENPTGGTPSTGGTPAGNSNGGGGASGGQRPATGGAAATPATLLPWKVGNSWTYRVTASGSVTEKNTTIEAAELVGGSGPNQSVTAFRVVTRKGASGSDESISWQGVVGEKVVRYREQSFGAMTGLLELEEHWSPYKLHVDSAAVHALGAMWVERYDETKMPVGAAAATASASDVWSTISSRQSVTVPAGTFDAVVFQKSSGSGSVKTYYYAQGIGKVKEVGASQVEELTAFTLAP